MKSLSASVRSRSRWGSVGSAMIVFSLGKTAKTASTASTLDKEAYLSSMSERGCWCCRVGLNSDVRKGTPGGFENRTLLLLKLPGCLREEWDVCCCSAPWGELISLCGVGLGEDCRLINCLGSIGAACDSDELFFG